MGYIEKEGKCIKTKKGSGNFNLGMEPSQKFGIFVIILSFVIYFLKPYQDCAWYNIFCHAGSATFGSAYTIVSLILLLGGVAFLLKLDKLVY